MPKFGNSHGNVLEMKDLLLSFRCEIEVEKNSKITVTLKSYFLDHDLKSSLPVRDHGLNNRENIEQITIEREDKISI